MKTLLKLLSAALFLIIITIISSCTQPIIPQGYALIYGVADYGGANDLNYTDDDAEAFAGLLTAKGWDVRLRIDSEATLSQLQTDVSDLSSIITAADRLLFYYSGHGVRLNLSNTEPSAAANPYDEILLLYNSLSTVIDYANGNQSADVLSVTVSDDSLAILLAAVPAVSRMVILDSCYSGGFIGDGFTLDTTAADYIKYDFSSSFQPAETLSLYLAYSPSTNDLPQSSFSIMAASGENEESYESPSIGHGYFTYFLLKSPSGADYNFDGYISFIEAYKYTALSIDAIVNTGNATYDYLPHIAAFPLDPVLFKAD
ncbi:MAG: caspase family protein [Spirochaetales bacterium]|nr:caspase family protein [Spirochaetales bacterium]